MNSTVDNSSSSGKLNSIDLRKGAINDAAYSIGFSLAVLLVLLIVSYFSYKCNRSSSYAANSGTNTINFTFHRTDDDSITVQLGGLDEATLVNHPKLLYSQAMPHKGDDPIASGCSICLSDYKETDMLRLLPECGHIFHLKCVDPWLMLHPTCPICRSSPLPTPLAEVVALSMHQS